MKRNVKLAVYGASALTILAMGCGKKGKHHDETPAGASQPGVTPGNGSSVAVSGKLALNTNLVEEKRKVLVFTLLGGDVFSVPTAVDVDAEGRFSANVAVANEKLAAVKKAMEQSPIDKAPLIAAFPEHAAEIPEMSDDDIHMHLQELIDQMAAQGGPQYILISYVPSGDALAEAKSFQFIGLPAGGRNVMVFPADNIKGNLGLGTITGSGDDATAELKAGPDVFSLDDNGLTQLANIGQTLKVVKNYWVNRDGDKLAPRLAAQPFFAWNGKFAKMGDGAAAFKYSGYGMYVRVVSDKVSFDKFCPASGTPTQSLQLFPPADVKWANIGYDGTVTPNKTLSPTSPFNNGQPSHQDQDGKTVCNGNETGFYGRDDGHNEFMLNWGTGGSLQDKVPAGFWDFKVDTASLGQFDLSSAYPVDEDGNAKVLVPVVSLTKSGDALTDITVKFAVYNPATKAYDEVKDVSLFKKMASQVGMSLGINNNGSMDEVRGVVGSKQEDSSKIVVTWDGATLKGAVKADYQKAIATSWSDTGKIMSVVVSYQIGGSNYRFDFRL